MLVQKLEHETKVGRSGTFMHGKIEIPQLHVYVMHTNNMISMLQRTGTVCCNNQAIRKRDRLLPEGLLGYPEGYAHP